MDNAQKAIMIGVGLFITIIIISAVLLIVNLGTGLVDDATDELGAISTNLQASLTEAYDSKQVSGSQVLSAVKNYSTNPSVSVVVYDSTGAVAVQTGAKAITAVAGGTIGTDRVTGTLADFGTGTPVITRTARSSFATAINTSGMYNSSLVINANGAIVGIAFKAA